MSRVYPQRGDLVHICEGGDFWYYSNPEMTVMKIGSVIHGAMMVCTGTFDSEEPGTTRPAVYINGQRWVYPNNWEPVYGPPVKEVILGGQ